MKVTKPDGSNHYVLQIHYQAWPDHGVPSGKSVNQFKMMLDKFIDWNLKSDSSQKAIVHCSAGIGRTGTTVSLMDLIITICAQRNMGIQDPELSPFQVVRRLRELRHHAV